MVEKSPWDVAHRAADRAGVKLAPLTELDDTDRVRAIVARVWGAQDMPRELLRAFQHAGVVLYGAEADHELVGFVFGFLGFNRGLHLHSHMLAALPEWQSRGVGYALKLAQRAVCLDHGVEDVRWTFDPLIARNARFNLAKLGVVGTSFLPAHYGEMGDLLNRGDRSDRFEVTWSLASPRVERVLAGEHVPVSKGGPVLVAATEGGGDPEPVETGTAPGPGAVVQIPNQYFELRHRRPQLGAAWREAVARSVTACFEAGLEAVAFTEDGCYVFAPKEEAE